MEKNNLLKLENDIKTEFTKTVKKLIKETMENEYILDLINDVLDEEQETQELFNKNLLSQNELNLFSRYFNLVKQLLADLQNIENKKIKTLSLYLNKQP